MNKLVYLSVFAAVIFTAATGCKRNSEEVVYKPLVFDKEQEVKFTPISDEILFGGPARICKIGDFFAVLYYQRDSVSTFLHVFNKFGQKMGDYIPEGRGPKEGLMIMEIQNIGSDIILNDLQQKKVMSASLDSSGNVSISENQRDRKQWMINSFRIGENYLNYFAPGPYIKENRPPRLDLESSQGYRIATFYSSPLDYTDPMLRFKLDAGGCSQSLSPNGKHFVITYYDASIIELFTIDKSIKETYRGYFYPPKFKVVGTKVEPEEDRIWAFNALYAANSYVFASYDGDLASAKK